jgi:hypothetical protein
MCSLQNVFSEGEAVLRVRVMEIIKIIFFLKK